MPSKCYVFNEWVLYDLLGEHGPGPQETAGRLLQRLKEKCDRIAISRPTPWTQKAFLLMKCTDPRLRTLSKHLHREVLLDSRACLWLHQSMLDPVSEREKERLPADDIYLVQVYRAAKADLIVTHDSGFYESARKLGIRIVLRDDFLSEYLREL